MCTSNVNLNKNTYYFHVVKRQKVKQNFTYLNVNNTAIEYHLFFL